MTRVPLLLSLAWLALAGCNAGESGSIDLAPRARPRCEGVECAAGLACDPASGRCVACLSDAECTPALPHCQAGTCVECETATDCVLPLPICSASLGRCVECEYDVDCRPAHVCEATEGECEDAI
jgi:hypothetical protein